MRIALVGTRGVPARYGGFETCVEEVGSRLVERGHEVVVYCRRLDGDRSDEPATYKGMELVHLGAMKKRSLETLSHTGLSVAHLAQHRTDAAIVFNSANAPWLPVLKAAGIPFATHVDGLEWQRGKWGRVGRRYYQVAERLSVWWSNALIADATGIQDYYRQKFDADTDLISYGAPVVDRTAADKIAALGLSRGSYHLVVARFEPENHVHMIVDGYRKSSSERPLIVVGSAPYANEYTDLVHRLGDDRVRFLGGVWDQELLDQLYSNAFTYWHGHSVGGTNPSLLRALGAGAPTTAFDVVFNREVLGDSGQYFASTEEVTKLLEHGEFNASETELRGQQSATRAALYDWDEVAGQYEQLCRRLVRNDRRSAGSSAELTSFSSK